MGIMAVLMLPLLLLAISGILFIYQEVSRLWSKSAVQNKVVVITDAISGLGKECSRLFHAGGARLVLCGKNWEKLEILYDALISVADPSKTFTPKLVLLDLSDISCVQDVAKEILDCYGCVDILINNASMKVKGPAQNISLELDKKIMDVNYFGPITLTKDAASKHAAQGFFDCLRAEVEEFEVVISTVSPTFIRSYHMYTEPGNWEASIWKFFFRKFAYGVHPVEVAEEVMKTIRRKKQEVFIANPIPKAAIYIRTFFPEFFFAVVACGVKEKLNVPEDRCLSIGEWLKMGLVMEEMISRMISEKSWQDLHELLHTEQNKQTWESSNSNIV
uniref:Dehydrogenase/reductase SDR family member 7C n=1 Tax=Monodelphis domestica TaxID=13616 RepID=A0A5F8GNM0_MONDO